MEWYWRLLIVISTFWVMEFVAWAMHKYVMHGFLWVLHKDHHVKKPGFFERNDAFFLIFAVPSWLCIMLGMINEAAIAVHIGYGIALYGIAYFMVHEVFIHRRLKWFKGSRFTYLAAIQRAHKMHHRHLEKEEGESFGMLIIHPRYWEAEKKARAKRRSNQETVTA